MHVASSVRISPRKRNSHGNDPPVRRILFTLVAVLAVGVGIYPLLYFLVDMSGGLMATKPRNVLESGLWNTAFYQHILFGGVAMLTGWLQFLTATAVIPRIRARRLQLHRLLGKVYLIACLLSGIAGLYLSGYATGGIIASFGFGGLAVCWLFSSTKAYLSIRKKDIDSHRAWMIRSYALTFAAVTLRIWLPLSQFGLGLEFESAYIVISWLCWVPNLMVAEVLIRRATPVLHAQLP